MDIQSTSSGVPPPFQPYLVEDRGIGGWLLFFVLLRTIGMLALCVNMAMAHTQLTLAVNGLLIAIDLILLVALFTRSRLILPALYCWMAASIYGLGRYLVGAARLWQRHHGPNLAIVTLLSSATFGLAFLILWIFYFKRSRRVFNTYGVNL